MAPDTLSLAGKTAIVTGSGRENGIGAAIATALARNGANVSKVAAGIEVLGDKTLVVQADVSTPEGAAKLIKQTLDGFKTDKIDILINSADAGTGQAKLLVDVTPDEAAAPYIPSGGRIVNIGTVVTKMENMRGVGLYGSSKAAQQYLTNALAAELGPSKGITVNTIAPGPTKTDAASWFPEGSLKTRLGKVAGDAEEVADAVLLMVSDSARWITGQYIAASGGITA
ncbi:hypothetical protein C8A03DRAFT_45877 [Achaetomium macrosporum]|uniref:Uncharacterized protein n=1 Tax=Achaetomium macrosporum TaxID=79813 RepID=A0AAN7C6E0_9PEZI|nr:hypothetical protein C8A03DRAFT_45877 [Achaetomium macrosporum]